MSWPWGSWGVPLAPETCQFDPPWPPRRQVTLRQRVRVFHQASRHDSDVDMELLLGELVLLVYIISIRTFIKSANHRQYLMMLINIPISSRVVGECPASLAFDPRSAIRFRMHHMPAQWCVDKLRSPKSYRLAARFS